ncbi:hypothetical protein JKA74_04475 [Marivirga sp. S37H4]|uniref:Uncharacterized protein n=1 Tax=Marivirga aurantiaca TaxID=2802615 RepID=A0A935C7C3_9BACT|nr:hypothetical protein [Marivirga aurantiaca]MBK6264282.1 hypothetical protein [Marivirga aurantiaca]
MKNNLPYGEEHTDFGGNWNVPAASQKDNGIKSNKNSKNRSRKKRN